jgi:hypothetical protein
MALVQLSAPASWLVSDDVKKGCQHLNFSTWADHKKNRKASKLEEIGDQLSDKTMPMKKYLLLHPSAQLSASDIEVISRWSGQERQRLSEPDSAGTGAK